MTWHPDGFGHQAGLSTSTGGLTPSPVASLKKALQRLGEVERALDRHSRAGHSAWHTRAGIVEAIRMLEGRYDGRPVHTDTAFQIGRDP